MPLISASIGTILGSIVFVLWSYKLFVPAIICLGLSTLAFTLLRQYRDQILVTLLCFLVVFFNFNLRSELLEYADMDKVLVSKPEYRLDIVSKPKIDPFFNSEFIVELSTLNGGLFTQIQEKVLPTRLLAKAAALQGLSQGDRIKISGDSPARISKLNHYKSKVYKSKKTFWALKNKDLTFVSHKENSIDNLQSTIQRYYQASLGNQHGRIINSLLMGSRVSQLPEKFAKQIRNLGLGHFFAASGFHLLILSLVIAWLFKLARHIFKRKQELSKVEYISLALAVIVYSALAGFSPSIIRAALFILTYILLQILNRKQDSIKLLILIAGIVLVIDPYTIYDLGFQLSYLATLSILLWASPIQDKLKALQLPTYITDILSVSLASQILLFPLIIYYFNNLQIWSLLANLVFSAPLSLLVALSFFGLSFLIKPLLIALMWLFDQSQRLPLIDTHIEISGLTLFLLTCVLLLITTAILYQPIKVAAGKFDIFKLKALLFDRAIQGSVLLSLFCIIWVNNSYPADLHRIELERGKFKNPEIQSFMKSKKAYLYTELYGLKTLMLQSNFDFKKLNKIKNNIQEIDLLLIEKLSKHDIAMDTLIHMLRPQFALCAKVSDSPRAQHNLNVISHNAHSIVYNGVLYTSRAKYWYMDLAP